MRSLLFLLLTAPLLAVAQNLGSEPPCAVPCLRTAIEASICDVNDQGCQCTPEGKASIQAGATACLIANCSATELVNVQKIGNELCVAYSSSVSSGAVTPSPTSTGAAGSGTGNASPTATTTSTRRSTEQTTSTVVAITTSIPSPGATTGTGVSSTGATGSGSGSGSPTATGASLSSTSSGNAAPTMVINYAAVVGGFAALLL